MNEAESQSKFDNVGTLQVIFANGQSMTRLPSLKNLGNLEQLWISHNKITEIAAGAFKGASRLIQINLQNNRITSVADGVFSDLTGLSVPADGFAPTNADGSLWTSSFGAGLWVLDHNALFSRVALPSNAQPLCYVPSLWC